MNASQSTETKSIAERAIRDLTTVGLAWARYGLTVSKVALETSAVTLQKTAAVLGDLSSTIKDKQAPAVEEPVVVEENKAS